MPNRQFETVQRGAASMSSYRRWLSGIMVVASSLLLGACSMTESTLIDAGGKQPCDSDTGSYYLSKTMFEVLVTSDSTTDQKLHPQRPPTTGGSGAKNDGSASATTPDALFSSKKLISVQAKAVADRGRGYCLDFLASPTAEEAIFVGRENGLLQKITTDARDRSADILKNIIKTVLLATSADEMGGGNRSDESDAPLQPKQLFKGTYDPLNPEQANLINQTLRQHGFCLVIEDQTFDHHTNSIHDYCDRPLGHHSREKALDKSSDFESLAPSVQRARGILYRPRVAYNYYLYVKRGNGWKLRKSVTVNLENTSPVIALGIDRAFFTTRKTAITFDQGVLVNVRVEKGSELAGFVEVPLTLAQGVAALPANIVKVKIDVTNQRSTLIAAQDALLAQQIAYNRDVANYQSQVGQSGERSDTSGQPQISGGDEFAFPAPGSSNRSDTGAPALAQRTAASRIALGATPLTPAVTQAIGRCTEACKANGLAADQCPRYCACFVPCRPVADPSRLQQAKNACVNYCAAYLP